MTTTTTTQDDEYTRGRQRAVRGMCGVRGVCGVWRVACGVWRVGKADTRWRRGEAIETTLCEVHNQIRQMRQTTRGSTYLYIHI